MLSLGIEAASPTSYEALENSFLYTALEQPIHRFVFGQPFIRYAILHLSTGETEIVTKLDHGLYDGTLLRIFGEHFEAYQRNSALERFISFKDFAFDIWQMDKSRTLSFWKESAKRPIAFEFPSASIKEPRINSVYVHTINLEFDTFAKSTSATVSIIFQLIFQLWLALRSNQRDVAFDYLHTGRSIDLADPQTINGTCANFLPMCSTVDASIPYTENSTVGMDEIHKACETTREGFSNKTLFIFQLFEPVIAREKQYQKWIVMAKSQVTMPQPYAVVFEVKTADVNDQGHLSLDCNIYTQPMAKCRQRQKSENKLYRLIHVRQQQI
ncbi:hypothetical protein BDV33DRAFT_230891 [Aspergillus novoparasiticus]|uniref:Condensation domain-containing protein n=1 Tax=Aspergillus novoparasiticus TaxID=986946 RepID=A0A5N6E6P2_9EURO|nr:hypothetical protein BDV33DRAFT_230891 [Aspergillus novoparasiticus]